MYKFKVTLWCFIWMGWSAYAQTQTKENTYIQTFKELFALKLSSSNNAKSFIIKSPSAYYHLSPQSKQIPKIGLNYQFISVQLTLPIIDYINSFDDRKGTTKTTDIGLNLFMPHWHHYLLFQRTKGYYLKNTQDFVTDWDEKNDDYIQFSDLVYTEFSGVSTFATNSNFSLKSLTNQSEKQIQSVGSWVPSIAYKYYIIDNQENITSSNSTQKSNNIEFVLQTGYWYNYVLSKKFFLSGGISAGCGYKFSKLKTRFNGETINNHIHSYSLQIDTNLTLGFDNKRWFTGIQASKVWKENFQKNTSTTLIEQTLRTNIYLGYRFNSPKKLDKFLKEKIMKKFHIL